MTFDLLVRLTILMSGLIVIGSLLCLPLYKWSFRALFRSSLFTKIIWWIPIFITLIAILYGQLFVAVPVTAAIIIFSVSEYRRNAAGRSRIAHTYLVLFIVWMFHLAGWFWEPRFSDPVALLAAIAVASVLSDVCAFFLGNYAGKHKLPALLNNRKSWEGVAGQLIGAFIGALLASLILNISLPILLIITIGIASAVGDLLNSAAKRSLDIKDWSQNIPGHGGFLDRFSSLSFAIAASYWLLTITT